ncbi:hypothetical protein [Helicobacter canis]|uniref:hypothetical protein n=1 Tax=Helicobacter canis TaxID=29419 RepID=UPI0011C02D58|nr:hypothetical protein [Helicobacter canis]
MAFSKGDSALGNHSADLANFRATADSCSALKFAKNYESPTAKQATAVQGEAAAGFFRTPRILEEDDRALCEKSTANKKVDSRENAENVKNPESAFDKNAQSVGESWAAVKVDSSDEAFLASLRADLSARQSIQKSTTALESTFDKSQNERAEIVFDKNAELQKVDSRIFHNTAIFAATESMDSKETSANAERYPLFCHATATQCLAMTEKSTANKKVDSRENAQGLKTPQAAGFLKEYQRCPSDSKISRLELGFLLKKPAAASPCTASLVFKPRKEIRLGCLSTKRGDEIHDSSPKAESKNLKG